MLTQSEFLKGRHPASIPVPSERPGRARCRVFYQETLLKRAPQNEKCLNEGPVKRNTEMQPLFYRDPPINIPTHFKGISATLALF